MEHLEKLIEKDPSNLNETQQLAVLLKSITGEASEKLAENLLQSFGGVRGLIGASFDMLVNTDGINEKTALALKACMGLILSAMEDKTVDMTVFTRESAANIFKRRFAFKTKETMYLMMVDKANRILGIEKVAEGSHDRLRIDMKDIINIIVKYNAAKAVLAHTHYSGLSPSIHDVVVTSKLVWLLGHLSVELCDHLIFFEGEYHSMLDAGELTPITYNLILNEDF